MTKEINPFASLVKILLAKQDASIVATAEALVKPDPMTVGGLKGMKSTIAEDIAKARADMVATKTEGEKLWGTLAASMTTKGSSIGPGTYTGDPLLGGGTTSTGFLYSSEEDEAVTVDEILDRSDLKAIVLLLLDKLGRPVYVTDIEIDAVDVRRLHVVEDSVGVSIQALPDYLVFEDKPEEEPDSWVGLSIEESETTTSGSTWPIYTGTSTTAPMWTGGVTGDPLTGWKLTGTFKKSGEWTLKDDPK